jgi:hypothetical protein
MFLKKGRKRSTTWIRISKGQMEEIKDFVLKKAESRVCKLYEI